MDLSSSKINNNENRKKNIEEKEIKGNMDLSVEQTKIILTQIDVSICRILIDNSSGTGFFCLIPIYKEEKKMKALVTNNHILGIDDISPEKKIKITISNNSFSKIIYIDSKRKVYTNYDFDITIIEIKESDNLQFVKYLEIDEENINLENPDIHFKDKKIYIIQYPGGKDATHSEGTINYITKKDYNGIEVLDICHLCTTKHGSSGSPILNLSLNKSSYKVIGIHKGSHEKYNFNLGTFIKQPIDEFNVFYEKGILGNYSALKNNVSSNKKKKINEKLNEIVIKVNISQKDKGQKIYFMGNFEKVPTGIIKKNEEIYLNEINDKNVEIFIDNKKIQKFNIFFFPENEKEYIIRIKFHTLMKNCSYMFFNCPNIIQLNLSSFITTEITNMNHMFGRCYKVKDIDLNNFKTDKVNDISYMFSKCKKLLNIDLSFFETEMVTKTCCMFNECYNVTSIYMPFFNTENIKDMSGMFLNCQKIEELNLMSFNTKNVIDMSHMFDGCTSLKELKIDPIIFNTENAIKMSHMFKKCNKLEIINLSINTKNANILSHMFNDCFNLKEIDLSKFDTRKVKYMNEMFKGCINLGKIDLSNFSFESILNKKTNNMFYQCKNLKEIYIKRDWKEIIESTNDLTSININYI